MGNQPLTGWSGTFQTSNFILSNACIVWLDQLSWIVFVLALFRFSFNNMERKISFDWIKRSKIEWNLKMFENSMRNDTVMYVTFCLKRPKFYYFSKTASNFFWKWQVNINFSMLTRYFSLTLKDLRNAFYCKHLENQVFTNKAQ